MKKLVVIVMLLALALPLSASAATPVTYTAGFELQNLSTTPATVVIDFYDQAGNQPANSSVNATIPGGGNANFYPLNSVPQGFNGSAVVSSDQPLASITNVLGNGGQRGSAYGGFVSGGSPVSLPLVTKAFFGIDTWFNVQNTGTADTTVNVAYSPGSCTDSAIIKPNASATFDQTKNTCLPNGFVGGAVITSAQPIVAVVMQVNPTALLAYSGFTAPAANPIFPLVSSNFYNSGTGIAIQNRGSASTDVTVHYSPSGGGLPGAACDEKKTIGPGATVTFAYTQLPAACGTKSGAGVTDAVNGAFVGSASVTVNSTSQPLAAIVNSVVRDGKGGTLATADSYNAVDATATTTTSKVSLPLVMDRYFKISTGFSIMNVGGAPTTIHCDFTGTGYKIDQTVAAGAALTIGQQGQIASSYVGSATCSAANATDKIVGIVNELTSGAPATTDALLIYPAFNY